MQLGDHVVLLTDMLHLAIRCYDQLTRQGLGRWLQGTETLTVCVIGEGETSSSHVVSNGSLCFRGTFWVDVTMVH